MWCQSRSIIKTNASKDDKVVHQRHQRHQLAPAAPVHVNPPALVLLVAWQIGRLADWQCIGLIANWGMGEAMGHGGCYLLHITYYHLPHGICQLAYVWVWAYRYQCHGYTAAVGCWGLPLQAPGCAGSASRRARCKRNAKCRHITSRHPLSTQIPQRAARAPSSRTQYLTPRCAITYYMCMCCVSRCHILYIALYCQCHRPRAGCGVCGVARCCCGALLPVPLRGAVRVRVRVQVRLWVVVMGVCRCSY
jgi:hypothetical protein